MEDGDYHTIYKIAEKLDIDPPEPTEENIKSLVKTRDKTSQIVNKLRGSYPWRWYLQFDESEKAKLITSFIKSKTKSG